MLRFLILLVPSILAPIPSLSDVVFETSEEIVVVRIQDVFGSAVVELIAPNMDMVTCVLTDAEGSPVAVAQGAIMNGAGQAIANNVDASSVAKASCNGSSF